MSDLAVCYLPAGRVAQHMPLPAGLTVETWALGLLGDASTEGVLVAVVDAATGLCGPATPPPDARLLAR